MKFTAQEIALCSFALRTTGGLTQDGQHIPRQLALDEIADGVEVNKKTKVFVVGNVFTDGDIEFATTEKALLLKLLERPWGVEDAEVYMTVAKKLS